MKYVMSLATFALIAIGAHVSTPAQHTASLNVAARSNSVILAQKHAASTHSSTQHAVKPAAVCDTLSMACLAVGSNYLLDEVLPSGIKARLECIVSPTPRASPRCAA